ncbi:MAG: TIR domain-containing protein [Pseudomonadota bacterium]
MSEKEPIRVFVSHVFSESDDYLRIFEYLESVDNFFYLNISRPEDRPSGSTEAFKETLLAQIKDSEVVLMLGSVYEQKADWAQYQIEAAKANNIPIVAVNGFGGTIVLHQRLIDQADVVVDWNAREIVDAIRNKGRDQDTNRWEVIDFP